MIEQNVWWDVIYSRKLKKEEQEELFPRLVKFDYWGTAWDLDLFSGYKEKI